MQLGFGSAAVLLTIGLYASPLPNHAAVSQSGRADFVRVFSAETPGLTPPVALWLGSLLAARDLREIGGSVEIEITVGTDGRVRDALVRASTGGTRVEADAIRVAANASFRPGTLDGKAVSVRLLLRLQVPSD